VAVRRRATLRLRGHVPLVLKPTPLRASLDERTMNPEYRPPPQPWSERWPWLVYVVLSVASLVLLGVLCLLCRELESRVDQKAGNLSYDLSFFRCIPFKCLSKPPMA